MYQEVTKCVIEVTTDINSELEALLLRIIYLNGATIFCPLITLKRGSNDIEEGTGQQ